MKKKSLLLLAFIGFILIMANLNMKQTKQIKKMAGETVSWSVPSTVIVGQQLSITVVPNGLSTLKAWTAEHINIPSGWTFSGLQWSGGSGLGAQGCNQESGYLNCAAAGSTPADVPTQLVIKFTAPSSPISNVQFTGSFTTTSIDSTTNSGSFSTLSVNVVTATYSCIGSTFINAQLCTGDDTGLTASTSYTLVDVCGTPKCEYICNNGYSRSGSICVATTTPGTITVLWSAPSTVNVGGILNIAINPSTMALLTAWTAEHINIPSGWTFSGLQWSGGSGLGAQGCNQESGYLNCAAAGSTPADVPTQLVIKFTAPSSPISNVQFTGSFTTTEQTGAINNGNLNVLQVNVGPSGCTSNADCISRTSTCKDSSCVSNQCVDTNINEGGACTLIGGGSGKCLSGVCSTYTPPTYTCTQLGGSCKSQSCASLNMSAITGASDCTICCKPVSNGGGGAEIGSMVYIFFGLMILMVVFRMIKS